jgi:hypothetical protein
LVALRMRFFSSPRHELIRARRLFSMTGLLLCKQNRRGLWSRTERDKN